MGLEWSPERRKQLNICRSPSIPFQAQPCWLYGLQIPAPSVCPTLQPASSFSLLAEGLVEQMSQVSRDQLFPLLKVMWLTLTETGLEATTAAVGQQGCGRGSPHFSKGMITGSWGCWRQQPLQLTQGHLEREHKHQVSLTGGAQFELITSQAISHQLITTFGYCGSDWFRQEARAEILCLR